MSGAMELKSAVTVVRNGAKVVKTGVNMKAAARGSNCERLALMSKLAAVAKITRHRQAEQT